MMNLPKYLTTVTSFSKIIAAVLFITLPFIGFYLGQKYEQQFTQYLEDRTSLDRYTIKPSPVNTQDTLTANPDSIGANWKTYSNDDYMFEFQYPSSAIIQSITVTSLDRESISLTPNSTTLAGHELNFKIVDKGTTIGNTQIQWIPTMFAGRNGYTKTSSTIEGPVQTIVIEINSTKELLIEKHKNIILYDQILSTFKFTDQ